MARSTSLIDASRPSTASISSRTCMHVRTALVDGVSEATRGWQVLELLDMRARQAKSSMPVTYPVDICAMRSQQQLMSMSRTSWHMTTLL